MFVWFVSWTQRWYGEICILDQHQGLTSRIPVQTLSKPTARFLASFCFGLFSSLSLFLILCWGHSWSDLDTCSFVTCVFATLNQCCLNEIFSIKSGSISNQESNMNNWQIPMGVRSIHTMERALPLCCLCPVCAPGISMPRAHSAYLCPLLPSWLTGISSIYAAQVMRCVQ